MIEKMIDKEEKVVDDLEKKRFIFLENIGIEMLIYRMEEEDMEMRRRMRWSCSKTSSPSFFLSNEDTEDAKKSTIKFMRLNHEKYEYEIMNLSINEFGYSKAKYKIVENGKDFMKTKPYISDDDDIWYIKRYPPIKELVNYLYKTKKEFQKYREEKYGYEKEYKHIYSFDWIISNESDSFIETMTTLTGRFNDLRSVFEYMINEYGDDCHIGFDKITYDKNRFIVTPKFFFQNTKQKEQPNDIKNIDHLINHRIKEKYGFKCYHTTHKYYNVGSLLTLGLFDSNDIKILLENAKEEETTIFKILTSLPGHINSGNIKEYKKFLGKYVEMYFKKNYTSKEEEKGYLKKLLYYHLESGTCDSLEIIELFWDGSYAYEYFNFFLIYFKGLDFDTIQKYLEIFSFKYISTVFNGNTLQSICCNNTITLDVINKFISQYEEYNRREFNFEYHAERFDFLYPLIMKHRLYEDNRSDETIIKMILFFTEKGVSFKENSLNCYLFALFSLDYEKSLEIIHLYVLNNTRQHIKDSKISNQDLVNRYKQLEDEKNSLVASLCYNKQSSFDFLKLLLDNDMDVNKKVEYKKIDNPRNKTQGLAIYNVILNSDKERFELIKKYDPQIQNVELGIDCMKFICQCNPTVEFGEIFFRYALEKNIKMSKDCFFYSDKNETRLCPDFLQLFFKYRQIFMKKDNKLVELRDEDILRAMTDNMNQDDVQIKEQLTARVMNIILENNDYLKEEVEKEENRKRKEEDEDEANLTRRLLTSSYFHDLKLVKSLLDNGIKVKTGHLKDAINNLYIKKGHSKELFFLFLDYASPDVILKCLDSIAKMDIRVEVVFRILLRVELLYPKYSKDEINQFLDNLSKGDKLVPWGYKGVIKEEDKDKGEIIRKLVMYQKSQLPLWDHQLYKTYCLFEKEKTNIFKPFVKTMHVLSKEKPFYMGNNPTKIPKNILYVIFTHLLRSYLNRSPSTPEPKLPLDSIHIIENNNIIDDDYENNTNKRKYEEEQALSILGSYKREKKK